MRTVAQLADNLAALDVALTQADMEELDVVSRPRPGFMQAVTAVTRVAFPGLTINGQTVPTNRFSAGRRQFLLTATLLSF